MNDMIFAIYLEEINNNLIARRKNDRKAEFPYEKKVELLKEDMNYIPIEEAKEYNDKHMNYSMFQKQWSGIYKKNGEFNISKVTPSIRTSLSSLSTFFTSTCPFFFSFSKTILFI